MLVWLLLHCQKVENVAFEGKKSRLVTGATVSELRACNSVKKKKRDSTKDTDLGSHVLGLMRCRACRANDQYLNTEYTPRRRLVPVGCAGAKVVVCVCGEDVEDEKQNCAMLVLFCCCV